MKEEGGRRKQKIPPSPSRPRNTSACQGLRRGRGCGGRPAKPEPWGRLEVSEEVRTTKIESHLAAGRATRRGASGLRGQGIGRGRNAAQLGTGPALRVFQKETLFPAETRGASVRGFRRGLQRLGRSDLRGDRAKARQARDQCSSHFLRSGRRCGGIGSLFRFRFVHMAVWGRTSRPGFACPQRTGCPKILTATCPKRCDECIGKSPITRSENTRPPSDLLPNQR